MNKEKEIENEKELLPIGTIVTASAQKEKKRLFMIIGYGLAPHGPILTKEGKVAPGDAFIFDYMACTYPEGVMDTTVLIGLNHADIGEIVYKGYETEQQKKFVKICKEKIIEYGEKILNKEKEQEEKPTEEEKQES